MYFRKRSDRTGGCAGDWLRVSIFYSYSGGGSFRRAGGWRKALCLQVSDERCHLSGACVLTEHPSWDALFAGIVPVLYAGVLSSGVGYTLQVVGQKKWSQQRHP